MPELAEVEVVRRYLDRAIRKKKITGVVIDPQDRFLTAFASRAELTENLKGAVVTGTGRRGKYFWLTFKNRPALLLHLGMTGNISIRNPRSQSSPKHLWGGLNLYSQKNEAPERLWFCRLLLHFADGTEVALNDPRRFARAWLTEDPLSHPRVKRLGGDPLTDLLDVKDLQSRLSKRRGPIKAVLQDQKLFAGVGNWLADEILYQAKLNPHHSSADLTPAQVRQLRLKVKSVIQKAVELNADYERFPKTWLFHHRWGKNAKAQTLQGHKIIFDEIGGRTSAWVPSVQK